MTSAEALVLPISSGCFLHENFPSVLAKIPILPVRFWEIRQNTLWQTSL